MNPNVTIGTKEYKLNKLPAFRQFHIVRKVGPILSDMLPAFASIAKTINTEKSESEQFDEAAKIFGPVFTGLSKLSDADAEFVLYGLLASIERKQESNWAFLASGQNLMFQDLDLPTMLQLAGRAFMYNLSDFFAALPRSS